MALEIGKLIKPSLFEKYNILIERTRSETWISLRTLNSIRILCEHGSETRNRVVVHKLERRTWTKQACSFIYIKYSTSAPAEYLNALYSFPSLPKIPEVPHLPLSLYTLIHTNLLHLFGAKITTCLCMHVKAKRCLFNGGFSQYLWAPGTKLSPDLRVHSGRFVSQRRTFPQFDVFWVYLYKLLM